MNRSLADAHRTSQHPESPLHSSPDPRPLKPIPPFFHPSATNAAFGRDLALRVPVFRRGTHFRVDHGSPDGLAPGALSLQGGGSCNPAGLLDYRATLALVQTAHNLEESATVATRHDSLCDHKARHLNSQVRSVAHGILPGAPSQRSGGAHGSVTPGNPGCREHRARALSAFLWVRNASRGTTFSHHPSHEHEFRFALRCS
jgi:hypothetical protein